MAVPLQRFYSRHNANGKNFIFRFVPDVRDVSFGTGEGAGGGFL